MKLKPTIGVIGSGRLGTAIAKRLLSAGYAVQIANSRGPGTLGLLLKVLLPGAVASSVEDAVTTSDVIILAIPLHQYNSLRPAYFNGKIVIDAMNYWPPVEGDIAEFMREDIIPSQYIQQYLPGARVVKSLNHVAYNELEQHSLPTGAAERRAIAMAGDDDEAKDIVAEIIDAIGFDPVDLGGLAQGRKFQPDTQLFNARLTAKEIKKLAL